MMRSIRKEKECSGAITLFLSLIICLVLSLVATMIEAARVSAAKVYSERVMSDAMQSVLADYYEPLYENYHIFALKQDDYEGLLYEAGMAESIEKYANYSLVPAMWKNRNLKDKNFLICKPVIKEVTITGYETLLSYDGELFRKQAISYMKYQVFADAALDILDGFHAVKETETVTYLLNEKVNVENKLAKADALMLELMENVEGICMDEYGVDWGPIKGLSHNDNFVKKFVSGDFVTKEAVAISNDTIFKEMKGAYLDPCHVAEKMTEYVHKYEQYEAEYETEQEERNQVYQEYMSFLASYTPKGEEESEEDEGEETKAAYESLLAEMDTILSNISHSMNECMQMVKTEAGKLKSRNEVLIEKITASKKILEQIKTLRQEAKDETDQLEETYKENKEKVSEEYYRELMQGIEEIHDYTDEVHFNFGIIVNLPQFEAALESNEGILKSLNQYEIPAIEQMRDASVQSIIDALIRKYEGYDIQSLIFDYSDLILRKEKNTIKETIGNLINSGIAGLVMDTDSLSDGVLDQIYLPSGMMGVMEEESEDEKRIKETLGEEESGGRYFNTLSDNLFDTDFYQENAIEDLACDLLFLQYMEGHFTDYRSENYKPSQIMQYELEYILFGKEKDTGNVKAMASKLVLVRTLINLAHVMTDADKKKEAAAFAASVVGFTGLAFLIGAVKYITLFIWALEEALVEVSALMQGKKVVFLTNRDSFQITFEELFGMTRKKIQKKGEEYQENSKVLSFDYQSYLKFFLYLSKGRKQNYRAMDIIQSNLQIEYEEGFFIKNCIYGYEAECSFLMSQIFLSVPYLFRKELKKIEGYEYQISEGASY
ncbi:MAG: hypothetical protein E7256_15400 [Lachnospiraceae bacterium]|nr:hypothetical protein [Lachnospiraceae bacterium]